MKSCQITQRQLAWLPEMSGAVNVMTPVTWLCRAVRLRILSPFLHSVSTVANLKSYGSNGAPEWHLDKSNQTVE